MRLFKHALNGSKISGPTIWGRETDEHIHDFLDGHGYEAFFVEGSDPTKVHQDFAATLEAAVLRIREIQTDARRHGFKERPVWPAIVLRTPKGWTGPKVVDGVPQETFISLFTYNKPVIFAFHGYPAVVHGLLHGRPEPDRFHARGYIEEGTTTTPFDMVVLNKMSRVHLCMDAIRYAPNIVNAAKLIGKGEEILTKHRQYVQEHFDDLPGSP